MRSQEKGLTPLSARCSRTEIRIAHAVKETPLDLRVNILRRQLTCRVLEVGDLLCQKNKDVEAAPVCTLFFQESNVDTGPCGWKDQFHEAAGPFEESGGGPLPLPCTGRPDKEVYSA